MSKQELSPEAKELLKILEEHKVVEPEKPIDEKMEIYKKVCAEHNFPDFVPPSGVCFHCHRKVFEDYPHSKDADPHDWSITCCPHCNTTFCD